MEESKGLATSFQPQPPMTTQGQPCSSLSTATYFGSNTFGGDDPFQFTNPSTSTQYTNSHSVTDVNSQVGNYFMPSQQDPPPPAATKQESVSMSTFSPVQDKQFFPTAAIPNTNISPPVPIVDQKMLPQNEDVNPPSVTSSDNAISITSTVSSDTGLPEQHPHVSDTATMHNDKPSGGEFFSSLASGKGQQTNATGNPQLYHCSYSNPGSQPESSVHHSDVPSGPLSLPAFPIAQQQYTTEVSSVGTITGTFTNADLPLSSMLQSGPIPQPTLDNKELLPNSMIITNADIPGFGSMPSHSSSTANLSSLCSTPVDAKTNADFFELDQQMSGVPSATSVCNSGPLTNADYKDVASELKQFQLPSTTGVLGQGVVMTTTVFQPSETGQALQTNTEFDNKASGMMDPPSNVHFSVGSPSQMDAERSSNASNVFPTQVTNVVAPTQVINVNSDVVSLQTTRNLEVVSSTITSTVSVSQSMPLALSTNSKPRGEVKTLTAVVDNAQHADAIEQQFLTSPVTQSPTSAFVEYSVTNNGKHENTLHVSSGTQSVSSLLDCPDTSILSSPYKIVLPSPNAVEEKQSSFPPRSTRMPENIKVSSNEQTASVTTSTAVHITAAPKTNPARGSTLPVTQATMTSTPKQKGTQDMYPAGAAPSGQQQESQQRYTGNIEQHKRDFKDTSSLPPPARQQEHDTSYHHQHRDHHHHVDHQSQYDYDYRHSRGSEVGHAGGHYIEDDRGYYPPSRPHSRMPYDYYHPHPHNDYYYYRGRSDYYRDHMDDPYYYEDSRYYHERDAYHGRDPYHGREQSRYYDRDQPRYRDARHYDNYPEYSHSREIYDDRRMQDPDAYRYHQPPQHRVQKRYYGEESHYPENVDDRTDQSYVQQPHTQPLETSVAPPEASTIYGPRDHFEASQVYNEETLHVQSSYMDNENSGRYQYPEQYSERYPEHYPEQYPERYPERYSEHYPERYSEQYPDQYPEQYPEQQQHYEDQADTVCANEETYYEQPPVEELPVHPVERELNKKTYKHIYNVIP